MPVAGLPIGDELVRHKLQPRPLPQPNSHPLLSKRPGSPIDLRSRLSSQQQISAVPDFNIQNKKIRAKISPARINNDLANLPGVIQVVRPQHAKSTPMILMCGHGPPASVLNAYGELAHR